MKKILILNGPNLNLLGKREPEVYGNTTFESYYKKLKNDYPAVGLNYFQSNHEGELIDKIHEVGFEFDGIIINAGGFSHTSIALADALASVDTPAIEVHISNIHSREKFRHHSFLTRRCLGIISGLGIKGYELALRHFIL